MSAWNAVPNIYSNALRGKGGATCSAFPFDAAFSTPVEEAFLMRMPEVDEIGVACTKRLLALVPAAYYCDCVAAVEAVTGRMLWRWMVRVADEVEEAGWGSGWDWM